MGLTEFVFWFSAAVLFTVYCGYPFLLYAATFFIGGKEKKYGPGDYYPTVTLIISVFNEASIIKEKLANSLAQDYLSDKYQVIVVSDGSTDNTERIVSGYSSEKVAFFNVPGRKGKTNALNAVLSVVQSDIVVFSDANSMYAPDAISKLVAPFQSKQVGGVCGELVYGNGHTEKSRDSSLEGLYWKYEKWIKRSEGKLSGAIVFNGSIYAIRRKLHKPMNIEAANDFQHAVQVLLQGYKNVYEPEAVACERTKDDDQSEFSRHVRIALRGWKGLFSNLHILNPLKVGFISFHFLLRKVLRWLSPVFLLLLLITNLILLNLTFYQVIFGLQLLFYVFAFGGFLLSRKAVITVFNPFYYFILTNLALLVAFIKFCLRADSATWTPTSHLE